MIDINFIRENPNIVKKAAADKQMAVDIDKLLSLDVLLREITAKTDLMRAERNGISKLIQTCETDAEKEKHAGQVRAIKKELSGLEISMRDAKAEFDDLMLRVPSVPSLEVPVGKGEEDNVEIRRVGQIRDFGFSFRDHVELCETRDMLDMPRAAKTTGSRSYYLKNDAVLLEMALCRFAVDF